MIVKYFKPGQIFTMYGRIWRVTKHTRNPYLACKQCDLKKYWQDNIGYSTESPCKSLCPLGRYPESNEKLIPYDCSIKMVIKQKQI